MAPLQAAAQKAYDGKCATEGAEAAATECARLKADIAAAAAALDETQASHALERHCVSGARAGPGRNADLYSSGETNTSARVIILVILIYTYAPWWCIVRADVDISERTS